jgi:hypothetical protein
MKSPCRLILLTTAVIQLAVATAYAEIEHITVRWKAAQCLAPCVRNVVQQLSRLGGTAEVVANQPQGQADIRWRPYVPFSVNYLTIAMGLAGPTIEDIRVRVRGTIISTPSAIILQSMGDNTQFVLLSPLQGDPRFYIPQNAIQSYVLAPEVRAQFLDAQRAGAIVTIEGPLFKPVQTSGLYLITQQVSISQPAPPVGQPGYGY